MQRLRGRIAGAARRVRDAETAPDPPDARAVANDFTSLLSWLASSACLLWRPASRPRRSLRDREGLASARSLSLDPGRQSKPVAAGVQFSTSEGRHHSALCSARETLACLEVAVVCSYVQQEPSLHDQLDRIVGTLVKLVAR